MTTYPAENEFAHLFKKYRLRSEIESLSDFGNQLAEEGVTYETSLFTRWQKGERIPKNRETILKVIAVFVKKGGVRTEEEINMLLAAVNQRDLNIGESIQFDRYLKPIFASTLPDKIYSFVGREKEIKDIGWDLLLRKNVLVYGLPGVGKTVLATEIAHRLTETFTDGIYWFQVDKKGSNGVIDEILGLFQANTKVNISYDQKIDLVCKLLLEKKNIDHPR